MEHKQATTTDSIELVAGDSSDSLPASAEQAVAGGPRARQKSAELSSEGVPSADFNGSSSSKQVPRARFLAPKAFYAILAIGLYLVGVCVYKEFIADKPYQAFHHDSLTQNPGSQLVAVASADILPGDRFLTDNVKIVNAPNQTTKYPITSPEPMWGATANSIIKAGTVIDARSVRYVPGNGEYYNDPKEYVLVANCEIMPGDNIAGKTNEYLKSGWADKSAPTFLYSSWQTGEPRISKKRFAAGSVVNRADTESVP